jgi:hypothetical protein
MAGGYHVCIACLRKWITYRFAICTDCEEIYGSRATGWPEWLRFKWNDMQKSRRRDKKILANEVSLSALEREEYSYD